MTNTDINLNSAPYRLDQRPRAPRLEVRIARAQRYLEEMAWSSYTEEYQSRVQELADLLVQAQALEVAANAREGN